LLQTEAITTIPQPPEQKPQSQQEEGVVSHIFREKKRIFSINKNQFLVFQMRRLEIHMDEVHM